MAMREVNVLLNSIRNIDWVAHVGQPVAPPTRVISSWKEVDRIGRDRDSGNLLIHYANNIRDELQPGHLDAYSLWNVFVSGIRLEVVDLVSQKLSPDAVGHTVTKATTDHIRWIVLSATIEAYYDELVQVDFFRNMIQWLLVGHLPLSWEAGEYPNGHAVIF